MKATLRWIALALILTGGFAAYLPGLGGGFVFDDYANLVHNERLAGASFQSPQSIARAALSSDSGPLKRPLSMLSFAVDHAVSGMDPRAFKLTNIFIHLTAGLGVFFLTLMLARSPALRMDSPRTPNAAFYLALLTTALWLLHPLQLTSVLYAVQRMTSLAGLFMLWGLATYAYGRGLQVRGNGSGTGWILCALFLFTPLATFSKEHGALLPLLLLIVELAFFRADGLTTSGRRWLFGTHALFALLPILAAAVYLTLQPDWILRSYTNRDYSLEERLLTQARALWFYLSLIAIPDISRMGLYHDDFVLSTGLLSPPTTLIAVIGLGAALLVLPLIWRRHPVPFFATLFFLCGHLVESSALGLELLHEHRNYLPSFGPLLVLAYLLVKAGYHRAATSKVVALCIFGLLAALLGATAMRAHHWGDDAVRALVDARNHPDSPRSRLDAGQQLMRLAMLAPDPHALMTEARTHYAHAARVDSYGGGALLGLLVVNHHLGEATQRELIDRITERLASPPLAAATPESVIALLRCQSAGICRFDGEDIQAIVKALDQNPALRTRARIRLYSELVQMFVNQRQFENALLFAALATSHAPEHPQLRLNLASTLLALGRHEEARAEAEHASRLDTDGFYARRIAVILGQTQERQP